MKKTKADDLAEFYDTTDASETIARARLETDTVTAPQVTTSLRLPRHVLEAVRQTAKARGGGATPTQVMREWIEAGLAAEGSYADAVVPLSAVRAALAELIEHSEPGTTPTDPTRKGLPRRRTA
jgi:hypothetical protein